MTLRRGVLIAAAAVASWTAASSSAHAAASSNSHMGGELGTPLATNPMALYYNPAGLGFSEGTQFGFYGGETLRVSTFDKAYSSYDIPDPPDAQGATTSTARVTNFLGGVGAFGASTKLRNLAIGAGFFAPITGIQKFDKNNNFANSAKYPLAVGGPARFYGTYDYDVMLYISAGAAYRFGPLSLGVTGNFDSATVKHEGSRTFTGSGNPDTANEGTTALAVSAFTWSFALGAMLELLKDQLWIAGSYQSQPGLGPITLTGNKGSLTNVWPPVATTKPLEYTATQTKSYPDIVFGGIRWRVKGPPIEFRVFGSVTRWSKLTGICTGFVGAPCGINPDGSPAPNAATLQYNRVNDKDSWAGRLGFSYWTSPAVELFVGGGYETAATIAATMSPESHDADNIQGSLGTRIKLTPLMALSLEYTHYYFLTRDNTGQSELARINGMKVAYPTVAEDGGGVYKEWRAQLNGSLEVAF